MVKITYIRILCDTGFETRYFNVAHYQAIIYIGYLIRYEIVGLEQFDVPNINLLKSKYFYEYTDRQYWDVNYKW